MKKAKPAPPPMNPVMYTVFKGVDWSASTQRPGCQDFLQHGSRVGDTVREYKTPILNSSTRTK